MMKSGEIPVGTYMRLGRVFRFDLEKIEEVLLTRQANPVDVASPSEELPYQLEMDLGEDDDNEENPYA
jgi:hypothetical protein